jgi:hypothetical protein
VLIWAATQMLAAIDRELSTSRSFRFTAFQSLTAIGRATGNREYLLRKGTLTCLQSTVMRTAIRRGEHWRRQQFSWINEWEQLVARSGQCQGIEFVLPEWFYQRVLDRRLVLAIDPVCFAPSGRSERWLHRAARKHAGRQPQGSRFAPRHLRAKSARYGRSGHAAEAHTRPCRVCSLQNGQSPARFGGIIPLDRGQRIVEYAANHCARGRCRQRGEGKLPTEPGWCRRCRVSALTEYLHCRRLAPPVPMPNRIQLRHESGERCH